MYLVIPQVEKDRLDADRLERHYLERERMRIEYERRREQERIMREREEIRRQQEQLRFEQDRRPMKRPYDMYVWLFDYERMSLHSNVPT